MSFTEPKPAKSMDERVEQTKAKISGLANSIKEIDLHPKIQSLEDKSVDFSIKVD